ncbi:CerR family C-terminal domain-containing protein [Geovibrio thiophilus]|nr:CerR family C-terminal domain-containing protein [Geovibrio thiophilus]
MKEKNKGERTKLSLIEAGIELFGEHGFTATGTRMIAEKAGANISAIQYYFGGKEGLYRAAVVHIAESIGGYINPLAAEIRKEFEKSAAGREVAAVCIKKAVTGLMNMMIKSEGPRRWSLIILREQAKPTAAFDILYESVMKEAHGLLSRIIAAGTGIEPDSAEAHLRAHAVIGSVLVFLSARETALRRLGTDDYTEEHLRLLDMLLPAMAVSTLDAEIYGTEP